MTTASKSYWEEIIQKWQQSGCNMTKFCRQEDLSIHTFKYWKYNLSGSKNSEPVQQELVKISEPAKLVPVKVTEDVSEIPEFSQSKLGRNNPKMAAIRLQYDRILPSGMSFYHTHSNTGNIS